MKPSPVSALWRLGPNPVLTLIAFAAAGAEAFIFNRVPETRILGMFQVLLFSSLLWFWLTVVWLLWFGLQAVARIKRGSVRAAAWIAFGLCTYFVAAFYTLGWIIFSQIEAFPDANWFRFMQSGYEVVWQEVKRSSPRALLIFYGICGLLLLLQPLIFYFGRAREWPQPHPYQRKVSLVMWLLVGVIAVGSFVSIKAGRDATLRQSKLTRFSTTVNPAITMTASLLAPYTYEAIKPNLNTALLDPIIPAAKLYATALETTKPKSVLYLAVESMRGDLLFREHQGREITPNLNALARRSLTFTRAYAQSTHTDYSVPSYLSSQYPLRSQGHYYYSRDDTWPKALIYEHLKHYGYRTAIISADTTNWGELRNYLWSPTLDVFFDAENLPTTYSATASDRGYVTNFKETPRTQSQTVPDEQVANFNMAWIDNALKQGTPWFLYSFFYQPHYPYKLGDEDERPFQPSEINFESTFLWFPEDKMDVMLNAYCNAVHETDKQIGRLVSFLESRGILDNTIIVITGDHGEAFGEHGSVTHAGPLHEEVVHVPLIIFAPGTEPQTVDFPVQHIDAAPTLCGLLGIPQHPGFQGLDVLNAPVDLLNNRDIFLHAEPPSSWRGDAVVHAGRWKLWHDRYSDLYYLFDLQNDPEERVDIRDQVPDLARDLQARLSTWRSRQLSYYTFKRYYEQFYPPDPH